MPLYRRKKIIERAIFLQFKQIALLEIIVAFGIVSEPFPEFMTWGNVRSP
nr:hypothetical protein [Prevotella corporis]